MGRSCKSSTIIFLAIAATSAQQFVPVARYAQNAVYSAVEDKVYFLGGMTNTPTSDTDPLELSQDFFSLDLSQPFDISSPSYTQLANGPATAWAAASMGFNDSSLWVIGGATASCDNDSLVHQYDVASGAWIAPQVDSTAMAPSRRREYSAVRAGQLETELYLFGGTTGVHSCSTETIWYDSMDVLQTAPRLVESDTSTISMVDTPQWLAVNANLLGMGYNDQAAVALQDGIVYLGGRREDGLWQPMTNLLLYNTTTSEWSYINATGSVPQERAGHSAITTDNGQIVVYGGIAEGSVAAYPDLAVLDTTQTPWTWSTPNIINAIGPRTWHSAIYRNGTMMLAFGMTMDNGPSDQLHMLDLETFTWDEPSALQPASTDLSSVVVATTTDPATTAPVSTDVISTSAESSQLDTSTAATSSSTGSTISMPTISAISSLSSSSTSKSIPSSDPNNYKAQPTSSSQARVSTTLPSPSSTSTSSATSTGQKAATAAAAAVTSVIGAAALAFLGGLYYVKHRKHGSDTDSSSQLSLMRDPPPVSTLNYSRPKDGTENSRRNSGRPPKRSITPLSLLLSTRPADKRASRIDPSVPSSADSSLTSNYRRTSAALIDELGCYVSSHTPLTSPTIPEERGRTFSVDMTEMPSLLPPPRLKMSKSKSSQDSVLPAIKRMTSIPMSHLPQHRRSITSPPERGFSWVAGQDVIDFRRLQQPRNAAHPPWLTPGYGSPPPTFGRQRYTAMSETSSGDELERSMRGRMVSISTVRTVPSMTLRVTNDV